MFRILIPSLLIALVLRGTSAAASEKLQVVTTVAPITNIVLNIGGNRIDLHGIVPEGTDSHTFEPAPSDIKYLAGADLLIFNGLHLEVPTEKLVKANMKPGARILKLGDHTIAEKEWRFDFSFPESEGSPNPHLWLNIAHAMRYAELVRDALVTLDPGNKTFYEQRTHSYLLRLKVLDEAALKVIRSIPPKNRKLVTYHDSWAYFCPRYGCTVIGAIQPSSFSDPPPKEMARLIDQLKAEKVPAIFGSEVFPSKILNQIGREAGVEFISTLRDDNLPGASDTPEHSYIGMMLENLRTMANTLGGSPDGLEGIDPRNLD
ncbi:MAG: metal ABC transporter substrate-binding protein [Nitrospira sp.]|nr:zinc ABC transporter substrate-binding protein [Candidatus Manganitrophaceae bacterium]HIL35237.1 zinc ABC transporter substrate-binding protein [Candidatus Manganitrophaceae bacterium]